MDLTDLLKVLLYNFFEDSTVGESQWRVIFNILPGENVNCPRFDELRHGSVCREVRDVLADHIDSRSHVCQLKFLYVAITRARKNLWIADNSKRSLPIKVRDHPGLELTQMC